MVKIAQNIQVAYEAETNYGDPPNGTLLHLGLLDTFDPRAVEMNITPVPSIGQSTDAFHARGPLAVTLPLKVACQGDGWKAILGRAIGGTDLDGTGHAATKSPIKLTNSVDSLSLLAKEDDGSTTGFTLVGGVVPNEVTLNADYTTGGYITLEANCTAQFTQDDADGNFSGFYSDNYSSTPFPAAITDQPLLPSNLDVTIGTAAATNHFNVHSDSHTQGYLEVGERYVRVFDGVTGTDGIDDGVGTNGVIDIASVDITSLAGTIDGDGSWTTSSITGGSEPAVNLLKGVYKTGLARDIFAVTNMTSIFPNLKTVALKIANNNTPIPGITSSTWLQHHKIARGKADVTLDISMTAENEDFYTMYKDGTTIPLIRLDFGASVGSIALTNGTITAFSRPISPGGEIVDTMTIKFRGAGDYKDFSAYAISADWTLQVG